MIPGSRCCGNFVCRCRSVWRGCSIICDHNTRSGPARKVLRLGYKILFRLRRRPIVVGRRRRARESDARVERLGDGKVQIKRRPRGAAARASPRPRSPADSIEHRSPPFANHDVERRGRRARADVRDGRVLSVLGETELRSGEDRIVLVRRRLRALPDANEARFHAQVRKDKAGCVG